jgi:hypothetical protein
VEQTAGVALVSYSTSRPLEALQNSVALAPAPYAFAMRQPAAHWKHVMLCDATPVTNSTL